MLTDEFRVRSPIFPTYSEVRQLLTLWDGVAKSDVLRMIQQIHDQTGTPQKPLDWSEPDVWIVERLDGNYYVITQTGIDYAASFARAGHMDPEREVMRAIADYNRSQREAVRERLSEMAPAAFERLARDLLDAMGYDDVHVTKQSGDKGVDVVATVRFGITSVREVVQVKRHAGSIGRPILDQLRGALPYHDAIQGTIITLGTFTKGCKDAAIFRGAAPITLIDGNRLMELMEEHGVGIVKKPARLLAPDEGYFIEQDEEKSLAESEELADLEHDSRVNV
jgi:restriction system protein